MTTYLMPDWSHYQAGLTKADVKSAARVADAVMLKATEGANLVDPTFVSRARWAKAAGLPWGPYHFVRQGDGAAQARLLVTTTRKAGGLLRPRVRPAFYVIDWEDGDRATMLALAHELRRMLPKATLIGYRGNHARENGTYVGAPIDAVMVPDYGPASLPEQYRPGQGEPPLAAWQYTDGHQNGTAFPSTIPGVGACDVSVLFLPRFFGVTVPATLERRYLVAGKEYAGFTEAAGAMKAQLAKDGDRASVELQVKRVPA